MIRRLATALRLVLLAQARARFFYVYAVVTAFVVAVMRFLLPDELVPLAVPAFLLAEPGLLGMTMCAAQRYLERIEGSELALRVSPLRPAEYLAAMAGGSALVATAAGLVVWVGVLGLDGRAVMLIVPLFLCSLLSGLVGFGLSIRYADITRFLLGVIPWVALFQLPLLAYFEAVPWLAVVWIPSAPAVLAFGELAQGAARPAYVAGASLALLVAVVAAFVLVARLQSSARLRGSVV